MSLPKHLLESQHEAPTVLGLRKGLARLIAGGALVCVLGGVLVPVFLTPAPSPSLADVPLPTVLAPTPLPDLAKPAELDMVRVTEEIGAAQSGDGLPVTYSVPRVMQAGDVLVQLSSVIASHPGSGWEEVVQATQTFRFELVDALTGDTIGAVDIEREEGVDSPPAVLAHLTEPRATYLRVAAEVRGHGTCTACGTDEGGFHDRPLYHAWSALLRYDKAG